MMIPSLELETWLVGLMAGSGEIFFSIALFAIISLSGFFRMNFIHLIFMAAIFVLMFLGFIPLSIFIFMGIIGGIVLGITIGKIMKN